MKKLLLLSFLGFLTLNLFSQSFNSSYKIRFYNKDKKGNISLISDTAMKNITDDGTQFKKSAEENFSVNFTFNESELNDGIYIGEVTKVKTNEGKFLIPHGSGKLVGNGLFGRFEFSGNWYLGVFHGQGKLQLNKVNYDGKWTNGMRNGYGSMQYENSLYIGEWVNDKKQGKGSLYFLKNYNFPICEYGQLTAVELETIWINDSANGPGKLTYLKNLMELSNEDKKNAINPNVGANREEVVLENKRNEPILFRGIATEKEIRIFISGIISDVIFNNKNSYSGSIVDSKLEGKGVLYYNVSNSKLQGYRKGTWNDGKFTGKATLPFGNTAYYKGQIKNDIKTGEGEMKYEDGSEYFGSWENDIRSGKGKFIWTNGSYYDGDWKNGDIEGLGTLVLKGRSTWKCKWKAGLPIDSGEVIYNNGAKYIGGVGGKKDAGLVYYFYEGYGKFFQSFPTEDTIMHNDSSYVGFFHEGLPHGKGEMVRHLSGNEENLVEWKYSGNWDNGKKHGQGKITFEYMSDFESYDGEWKNNVKHGKGKQVINSEYGETTYIGTWNDDKLSGYVEEMIIANDQMTGKVQNFSFKGQYSDDSRNGQGTEISDEGTYSGNFKNGLRNGIGKMIYKNGNIYEGDWNKGLKEGKGKLTNKNGTVKVGNFTADELLSPPPIESLIVGSKTWMKTNLTVTQFRNGDQITEAKTSAEYFELSKNGKPAYFVKDFKYNYVENLEANTKGYVISESYNENLKAGLFFYNWYALNDPRGLAPAGWRIPNNSDIQSLISSLGTKDIGLCENQGPIKARNSGFIKTTMKMDYNNIKQYYSDYAGFFNPYDGLVYYGFNPEYRTMDETSSFCMWSADAVYETHYGKRAETGQAHYLKIYFYHSCFPPNLSSSNKTTAMPVRCVK